MATYLTKGKQVYVEGRLRNYSYDDKDGKKVYATEVTADDVLLLGGRDDAGGGGAPMRDEGYNAPAPVSMPVGTSKFVVTVLVPVATPIVLWSCVRQ